MRLLFALTGLLCTLVLAACGATNKCSPSSCTGCCDSAGVCQAGNAPAACGTSGAVCSACPLGGACNFGLCGASGTGGGASGGGGGSGGGSGGGTGGGTGGSVTDWASYCSAGSQAVARFDTRCGSYSAQGAAEFAQLSLASCLGSVPPGFADGRAHFDATAAQACIDLMNSRTCERGLPSGCEGVVVGNVALNGNCYDPTECQAAFWCDVSTTCPGKCVARVAVGQAVSGDAQCVNDAFPYNGVCTAFVALGQSCAATGGSSSTRYCVSGAFCQNNVCVVNTYPSLGVGMACVPNTSPECDNGLQCVAGACAPLVDAGGVCDSAHHCKWDLLCTAANVCTHPGAAGATCGDGAECASPFFCNKAIGAATGTCVADKQAGAACAFTYECAEGNFCTATTAQPAGVCRAKGAVSASCTYEGRFSSCQDALYCTATSVSPTGVCANRKGAGASCALYSECQSRTCTANLCTRPLCVDPTP